MAQVSTRFNDIHMVSKGYESNCINLNHHDSVMRNIWPLHSRITESIVKHYEKEGISALSLYDVAMIMMLIATMGSWWENLYRDHFLTTTKHLNRIRDTSQWICTIQNVFWVECSLIQATLVILPHKHYSLQVCASLTLGGKLWQSNNMAYKNNCMVHFIYLN